MPYRTEKGIITGNITNKNKSQNPIAKYLVTQFNKTLLNLIQSLSPNSIHEVGAGEGWLSEIIRSEFNVKMRLSDISKELIENNVLSKTKNTTLIERSIYNLKPSEDSAELIVCCEVLEHIENPKLALEKLYELDATNYIFSVPREPLWCFMNFMRGKYLNSFGNTPGHIQHWSSEDFVTMLKESGFVIMERHNPIPWTMVLASKQKP